MSKYSIEIVKCDKCHEEVSNDGASGSLESSFDFEDEDGGYREVTYSDLCKGCAISLREVLMKWDRDRSKGKQFPPPPPPTPPPIRTIKEGSEKPKGV